MKSDVTIYIISKNRPQYLKRAIDSCLSQTYQEIKVIVVDDCSDQFNVYDLEEEVNSSKVTFLRMREPSGANKCRNLALDKADTKYITGLDDDDYFAPTRVEQMLKYYKIKESDISAVSTRHLFESSMSKKNFKNTIKMFSLLLRDGHLIGLKSLLNKNNVGNHILTTVNNLKKIGGFDNSLPALQDYETWLRLVIKFGPIFRINKFLYIKNDELISITNINRKKLLGFDYIVKKHQKTFKNKEHCVILHRKLYEKKYLTLKQAINLFKPGNRGYILWLLLIHKIRLK